MTKAPNTLDKANKVHRNCWYCDKWAKTRAYGCVCDRQVRRQRKRRERRSWRQKEVLDELAALTQELDLYDELK